MLCYDGLSRRSSASSADDDLDHQPALRHTLHYNIAYYKFALTIRYQTYTVILSNGTACYAATL
eukprot:scaffold90482_cov52-Attheya_sp.AAC.6